MNIAFINVSLPIKSSKHYLLGTDRGAAPPDVHREADPLHWP